MSIATTAIDRTKFKKKLNLFWFKIESFIIRLEYS